MLQFAVNMGFKEIYFLGMDNNFPNYINHKGELLSNDKIVHHFHEDNTHFTTYTKDMFEAAYAYAKEYCEQKGIKVMNATRGGKLEVFERVEFDALFDK